MKNAKYTIVLLVLLIGLTYTSSLKGQRDDMMYFFRELPHSIVQNPAMTPTSGFYLSIPVSGFGLDFNTSGFCYRDIINTHPIYPDSLRIDIYGLHEKLQDNNSLNLELDESLFGFGFRAGKNYISLDVSLSADMHLSFSKGILDFILYGTETQDREIKLMNGELLETDVYLSAGIGYAREIGKRLRVGAKAKVLFGLANIHTKSADITYTSEEGESMALRSNFEVYTSSPFGQLAIDTSPEEGQDVFNFTQAEGLSVEDFTKNRGYAVDLGAVYRIFESLEVSLGVTDLGFIDWQTNTQSIKPVNPNSEVSFSGISSSIDSLGIAVDNFADGILDTIVEAFDINTFAIPSYRTWLPTKIKAGVTWNFLKYNYLHALATIKTLDGGLQDSRLSLMYALRTKCFSLSVGNTFTTHSYFNPSAMVNIYSRFSSVYFGASFDALRNTSFNVADFSGVSFYFGLVFNFSKKPYWKKIND